MLRLTLLVALPALLVGCEIKKLQPLHCLNDICIDGGMTGGFCTQSAECSGASPVCDTDQKVCVECFGSTHDRCTGVKPRCENDKCVACVDDTQDCGQGGLCLPTGECVTSINIIHAAPNGSKMSNCGSASNACTLEEALVITMTAPPPKAIKLDIAGPYTPEINNFVVDEDVAIDMRVGAILHKKTDGPILEIKNNRTVAILGGTIEGAMGNAGDGILCGGNLIIDETTIRMTDKSGINATGGCNLTVTRATINNTSLKTGQFVSGISDNGNSIIISRSSLFSNHGGGISINNGTFIIVGNAFMSNGDNMSPTGGIGISASQNDLNRLDFNTISHNSIQTISTKSSGIDCNAGTNSIIGHYNIIWNNLSATGVQVTGSCKQAYSDIGPIPVDIASNGGHNFNPDPLLKDEQADPHLKAGSPAIGYADPGADLGGLAAKDIDGDARIARTGMGADIGADQYKPPPGAR